MDKEKKKSLKDLQLLVDLAEEDIEKAPSQGMIAGGITFTIILLFELIFFGTTRMKQEELLLLFLIIPPILVGIMAFLRTRYKALRQIQLAEKLAERWYEVHLEHRFMGQ